MQNLSILFNINKSYSTSSNVLTLRVFTTFFAEKNLSTHHFRDLQHCCLMISGYVDLDADLVGNWANVGRTRPRNPVGWSTVRPWRPNSRTHPRRLTGWGPADGRMEWIASFRRTSLSHPHCSVTASRARL